MALGAGEEEEIATGDSELTRPGAKKKQATASASIRYLCQNNKAKGRGEGPALHINQLLKKENRGRSDVH